MHAQAPDDAPAQALDVLHGVNSASERVATERLVKLLGAQGVNWHDDSVPGDDDAVAKVLGARVPSGTAPDVAPVVGQLLTDWTALGLLRPLDDPARRARWRQVVFPQVLQAVTRDNHVMAAPLGVHRINTLLYNRRLWDRFKLAPPQTWQDIDIAARALRLHGITPLAWSDEPGQVATVFETLLLSEGSPALYAELASARHWPAWRDPRVTAALARLRWLRDLDTEPTTEQAWTLPARRLRDGQAGMLITGDWAHGELMAWGAQPGVDFSCLPVPRTAGMLLYSLDTLAMLAGDDLRKPAQVRLAEALLLPALQRAYNQARGSVPVRMDIDPAQLDDCARDAWLTLAHPGSPVLPSIAHRLSGIDPAREAMAGVLRQFIKDRSITALEAQARLVNLIAAAMPPL